GAAQTAESSQPPAAAEGAAPTPTTKDPKDIAVPFQRSLIRYEKGFYQVVEAWMVENRGKATYVGDGVTLRFPLPTNLQGFEILAAPHGLSPASLVRTADGLATREPIAPGRRLVVLFYRVEATYGGATVERRFPYPVTRYDLLAAADEVEARPAGGEAEFRVAGREEFQGVQYVRLTASNIPAGARLSVHLSTPSSGLTGPIFAGLAAVLLAGGTGAAVLLRRRRNSALRAELERHELLRAIAELDDRLAGGSISEEEHASLREPKFQRLLDLTLQMRSRRR
ncbi:MAG: hypothetical protein ACE5JJ_10530, partial [Nitrospinota bacterium]